MVAQATPTVDDARGEDEPGPTHPYVEALTGLPGVEHIAVVDVSGRHVLGEWGGPPGSADALLDRAREAADPSRTGRRELEDVVTTTPSAIHLSRLVLAGPGHPQSVWVALRISRAQGSLPWSRAALAGLDGPMGASHAPRIPAPREAPVASGEPAPTFVPPPPVPAPVVAAPPAAPAAPKGRVALTARIATAPLPAVDPGADTTETTETAIALPDATDGPETAGPAAAVTHELVRPVLAPATPISITPAPATPAPATPAPATPAPASSAPAAPAPTTPAPEPTSAPTPGAPAPIPARTPADTVVPAADPGRRSSFAPVMVVLPPPSPVPEDGRTEEPAPMPYPVIFAPDPTAEEADGDGSGDDGPEPVDAPVSEDADPPDAAPAPTTPEEDAAPAADDEPRVARRLIHGFRRRA